MGGRKREKVWERDRERRGGERERVRACGREGGDKERGGREKGGEKIHKLRQTGNYTHTDKK